MSKNPMYSTDTQWYDPAVYNAITTLDSKYPNAIPVFGGALGAFNAMQVGDIDRFEALLLDAVNNAKFYKWHEPDIDVAKRFCHLCFIDPMLIEVYVGMPLYELVRYAEYE